MCFELGFGEFFARLRHGPLPVWRHLQWPRRPNCTKPPPHFHVMTVLISPQFPGLSSVALVGEGTAPIFNNSRFLFASPMANLTITNLQFAYCMNCITIGSATNDSQVHSGLAFSHLTFGQVYIAIKVLPSVTIQTIDINYIIVASMYSSTFNITVPTAGTLCFSIANFFDWFTHLLVQPRRYSSINLPSTTSILGILSSAG